MPQKDHDRIWNGRNMNDIIIMKQSHSIGISARGRALGCGHVLGPWALGPGLGLGRRRPASSTDANAMALIHDDNIIHMSAFPIRSWSF